MQVIKIDSNGIFISDEVIEEIPYHYDEEGNVIYDKTYVEKSIPNGMYAVSEVTPQWNGQDWVEVAEKPIVDIPVEHTLEEKNRADIDYISLMLGVDL